MSTGADCRIVGEKPDRWFLQVQKYPYGETDQYSNDGPFTSLAKARTHLRQNYANPGGYSIDVKFDCAHSFAAWAKPFGGVDYEGRECGTCGHYERRDLLSPRQKLEKEADRLRKELARVEAQIAKVA